MSGNAATGLPFAPCNCHETCGDAPDEEGTCRGLRVKREPLVEIVLVPRSQRWEANVSGASQERPAAYTDAP